MEFLTPEKIDILQDNLDRQKPIKFSADHEINSLADILYICLFSTNNYKLDSRTTTVSTCGYQCASGKYRSAQDMYLLARYYLSNITFKNVYDALHCIKKAKVSNSWYCDEVCRHVHDKPRCDKEGFYNYLRAANLLFEKTTT